MRTSREYTCYVARHSRHRNRYDDSVLVSVTGFVLLGWKLSQTLHQITAEVTFNVLQGRRIEDALREMRESLRDPRKSPA